MSEPRSSKRPRENGGKNLKKLSHSLSWALRHAAPELGLTMTADGFCPVDEVLKCKHAKLKGNWTTGDIQKVVETSDKQRFRLQERPGVDYGRPNESTILCIRANQGHTIKNIDPDLLLTRISTEDLACMPAIVHGTYKSAWESILKQGLKRMSRNHIHCASGLLGEDGVVSGMRRSCEVYIYIDARKCAEDGIVFFKSDNGVLLTAGVNDEGTLPVEYFSHVTDASASEEILLDNRSSNMSRAA